MVTKHPANLQDSFLSDLDKTFTLRLNLSGPPGCPLTKLQQKKVLMIPPLPSWHIIIGGFDYVIKHAEQNLDTGTLLIHLGGEWHEPEYYDARLKELLAQGWEVCDG